MGASTKIQDTNLAITKFTCSQCQQPFTNHDKETDNWELWWDTSGEPEIKDYDRHGFIFSIWVRDITHKFWTSESGKGYYDCPEPEEAKEVPHA